MLLLCGKFERFEKSSNNLIVISIKSNVFSIATATQAHGYRSNRTVHQTDKKKPDLLTSDLQQDELWPPSQSHGPSEALWDFQHRGDLCTARTVDQILPERAGVPPFMETYSTHIFIFPKKQIKLKCGQEKYSKEREIFLVSKHDLRALLVSFSGCCHTCSLFC